ncbi:unnamed protein product, partial [Gongylonema pulchrum]
MMLVGSTWAVLRTEQARNVVDVILPKQIDAEKMESALKRLEKTKLDMNATKSQNVFTYSHKSVSDKSKDEDHTIKATGSEAQKLLREIKKQQKEQEQMLQKQQAIAEEMNKHREMEMEARK